MITAIVLIIILSVLVLIHEFGHYSVAKKVDVRVEEFGWGLPPRIWGKKIGETIYSINWLPFGGFVKLTGEDFGEEEEGAPKKDPRNFKNKTPLQRGFILAAGVFMNLVLAVFLYYMLLLSNGNKSLTLPMFFDYNFKFGRKEEIHTVVSMFAENSPAETAGIEFGEAIIEINNIPVYSADDIKNALSTVEQGQEISVLVMDVRGTKRPIHAVKLTPVYDEESQRLLLGVLLTNAFRLDYSATPQYSGLMHTWNMFAYSASTLGDLIGLSIKTHDVAPVAESVSGPVGITRAVSGILDYKEGNVFLALIDLTALLSISLAFLNILPFPALDGGRILFVVIEGISGKKIPDKIEGTIHKWGMLVLLGLILLITVKDVVSLI